MAYQRGSLKKVSRREGATWVLRYRVITRKAGAWRTRCRSDSCVISRRRRTHGAKSTGWGYQPRQQRCPCPGRTRFDALAEHYLKADFGEDAVRPKSVNTIPIVEHYVRDYLIARWGRDCRRHQAARSAALAQVAAHGQGTRMDDDCEDSRHHAPHLQGRHPARAGHQESRAACETRSKTNYKAIVISPQQTLAIIKALPFPLHSTLVLTCAATALRASEILSLRWADILWNENRIRVSKRWAKGEDGETKTEASDGYVPLHPLLAHALAAMARARRLMRRRRILYFRR